MSDGTLRYLAIITSLLDSQEEPLLREGTRTLVVEEIENGLFPSQAERVLNLLRRESSETGTRLVATTHSPALLDALRPEDHEGVVICDRSAGGWSSLTPLVEHPRYVELAAAGQVGRAVTRGVLESREPPEKSLADVFSS
jgi:predicted ATPase